MSCYYLELMFGADISKLAELTSPVTIFGKVISKQIEPLGKKVGLDYFSGKLVLVFFYLHTNKH